MPSEINGNSQFNSDSLVGQYAFRNILVNPRMQFVVGGFAGDWSLLANGDYGYVMWAKKDASTIAQVVEEGNYKPGTVYTLSGANVSTQQLTSPASGAWQIEVPNNATDVQLEEGEVATPLELRPQTLEQELCQAYWWTLTTRVWMHPLRTTQTGPFYRRANVYFPTTMRAVPAVSGLVVSGSGDTPDLQYTGVNHVVVRTDEPNDDYVSVSPGLTLDAQPAITL